jgi:hypothetical protein
MEQHKTNAIDKQFNKIVYLIKKLDTRMEELQTLLSGGPISERKKVPVILAKPTLLEFK